jgi:predicted nucleotidyltransferase
MSDREPRPAKPYTIEQIREIVAPIARQFGARSVWLFGSYARGDFNLNSDVDFRVDMERPCGYFKLAGFLIALKEALDMNVALVAINAKSGTFYDLIKADEVIIYEFQP